MVGKAKLPFFPVTICPNPSNCEELFFKEVEGTLYLGYSSCESIERCMVKHIADRTRQFVTQDILLLGGFIGP